MPMETQSSPQLDLMVFCIVNLPIKLFEINFLHVRQISWQRVEKIIKDAKLAVPTVEASVHAAFRWVTLGSPKSRKIIISLKD